MKQIRTKLAELRLGSKVVALYFDENEMGNNCSYKVEVNGSLKLTSLMFEHAKKVFAEHVIAAKAA